MYVMMGFSLLHDGLREKTLDWKLVSGNFRAGVREGGLVGSTNRVTGQKERRTNKRRFFFCFLVRKKNFFVFFFF